VERLDPPAANDERTPRENADASGSFRSIRAKVPAPARVRLRLGQAKVELRAEHFQKLARLWRSRRRAAGWDSETVDATSASLSVAKKSDDACYGDARFLRAAFACSARVVAAQGGMHRVAGGHHAALPYDVFDVLKYGPLRVEAELFASPLNCRYDVFCSAHADVDAPFGSLGSFFAFEPKDGSFEVNPPFESDVVLAVARRLERLLKDAEARNDALSFTVITPYWPKRAAWEALNKSAFRTRAPVVVAARDHFYVDGAQHCKRKTHKPASCDTSVLFLQTSRGREKYVATDETVEALRAAFRPTR
jgi:phosphorylated CTD-interacting factor 1